MFKPILTAGICLIIASLASAQRLVCDYDSSAASRPEGGKVEVSDIDPNVCTYLIFGFSVVSSSNELVPKAASDTANYRAFNNLKNRNPNLKTILSVGGPGFDVKRFESMAETTASITTFAQSAANSLRTNGFDGLNLDWRYPNTQIGKARFTTLCQVLSNYFQQEAQRNGRVRLLLTASVSAEKTVIDNSYDIPMIAAYLDFINVMTYNLLPANAAVTQHHSPLFQGSGDAQSNVNYAMDYWRRQGAAASKLNMGIPAFGRSFTLSSKDESLGAAASGVGEEGCFTGQAGFWAFYESCIYLEGVMTQRIAGQQVPFAATENQWVGFDDATSIAAKINYIKNNNYGGAFVSSLDLDDVKGLYCKEGAFPLLNQLKNGLDTVPVDPPAATTTTTAADNSGGQLTCVGKIDGGHPHPFDNTKFIKCAHGILSVFDCPAGLVYTLSCKCCNFP